ncbi:MAG: 23S rRNA (uracil(1939)-C(5))-methyltransferase RlmD [Chitinophagaceae bacterium]
MRRNKSIVLQQVVVEDYAAGGKSLAKLEGKVIFIENVVPGDVVDVRLSKNKKDWAEGYPVVFHSYSKERVLPFCQHFGVCGGCQWQMLPYATQLLFKQQQVLDNLTRIGKIELPAIQPIVGSDLNKWYRNKLEYTFSTKEFTVQKPPPRASGAEAVAAQASLHVAASAEGLEENNPGGEPENSHLLPSPSGGAALDGVHGVSVLGFHAKGFFDKIVDIQKCWLQEDLTNTIRNGIREYAIANNLTFYDIRAHRGLLRTMQVRICTTGEVMVNIVLGNESEKGRNKLLSYVKDAFPQITTLLYTLNLKMNDSIHDLQPQVHTGKGFVIEKLEDFIFKIGPKSFFQTNTKQAEQLYRITRDFAELNGRQTVYDLYCGTGSIGIFCSKGARKVVGVELQEEAVSDARENAMLNNIKHAHFVSGDVMAVCTDTFFEEHGRPDVIITDPPRAGMHAKLVEKILHIEASLVVYVSCNPATQARDLALLDSKYAVTRVQPVDMFPHTHHIENIVQLKLKMKHE